MGSPERAGALSKVTAAGGNAKNRALSLVFKAAWPMAESLGTLSSNPTSATSELSDFGHLTFPLWPFISLSGKWR